MVSVVNPTGVADIDGLLWGWKYDGTSFTYSFPTSTAEYSGYSAINNFVAFNAAEQAAVRLAFNMIASYANITFTETTSAGARFRFAEAGSLRYTSDPNVGGFTSLHAPGNSPGTAEATPPELGYNGNPPLIPAYAQGDTWFNNPTVNTTGSNYRNPTMGSYAMQAGIWHEIGHDMGLKHGHNPQNGHGITFPKLPEDHNSYEYSIMTYHQYVGDNTGGDNAPNHATSYMIDDIYALQYLYGANYNTHAESTAYRWDAAGRFYINNVLQYQPATGTYIFQAIWDGNGVDTYDFSAFNGGMTVNLAPGAYSTINGMLANLGDGHFARGSVYNAYQWGNDTRSLIENVVGGGGNDTIYGNAASNTIWGNNGNDTIVGMGGDDTILGGGGNDTIHGISGFNTIVGEAGNDLIYGGTGIDHISGGNDHDQIFGYDGNDILFGDQFYNITGNDTIYGGNGDDIISGETFVHSDLGMLDVLYGEGGNDTIYGAGGNDWIFGGDGNDVIDGGAGSDFIVGGGGADTMLGSGNSAFSTASAGGDLFSYSNLWDGGDHIYGFDFNAGTGRDGFDFRPLFTGLGISGINPRGNGYLYVVQNGADTQVYVDPNGFATGQNLVLMFTLYSANAALLDDSYFLFHY